MERNRNREFMSEKEKWYTLAEASQYAGVHDKTLYAAIKKGTLSASQISDGGGRYGFHYMISESALLEWVEHRDTIKVASVPSELTIDTVSEWITAQIQKAYEAGFKNGMNTAKSQMQEAVKGIK